MAGVRFSNCPVVALPVNVTTNPEWTPDAARPAELLAVAARSGGVERVDLSDVWKAPRPAALRGIRRWLLPPLLVAILLEALDTQGVPVIGVGTAHFPCFTCPPDPALRCSARVDDAAGLARAASAHWSLGLGTGVLAVQACPASFQMPRADFERDYAEVSAEMSREGVSGADVTPFLLGALARKTGGKSLRANVALLLHNARTASEIARKLLDLEASI